MQNIRLTLSSALGSASVTLIWMLIAGLLQLPPWPAFIGWCTFFLTGANWKAVKISAPCLIFGTLMAWANVNFTGFISPENGIIASALVTTLMAFIIAFAGSTNIFQVVAASFLGANIYFASGDLLISLALPFIGLLLGPISNWFTARYTELLVKDK